MKRWIGLAWVGVGVAKVWAVDGVIEICQADLASPPYVITQSGSYILTENLSVTNTDVNGIEVRAYHVTLDLNGFMLKGPGPGHSSSNGIFQDAQYENLTVENGTILDWAGGGGVWVNGGGTILKDVRVLHNHTGARLGKWGRVEGGMACTNAQCGLEGTGARLLVKDYIASGNGNHGLYSLSDDEWVVENSVCEQNGDYGMFILRAAVKDSIVSRNRFGMYIQGVAIGCVARANTNNGIHCVGSLRGCSATYNGGSGICGGGVVHDCLANYNGWAGFYVFGDISGCSANGNQNHGYHVDFRSNIHDCLAEGNTEAGIYLRYTYLGSFATAEDNSMVENGYGLLCDQATGNFIARNKAMGNTTNYLIGAGNQYAEILTPGAAFTNANPWANISD